MNCDEYLPLISGHLDGANSEFEERRLQEHLQTCESCRALLSQMEQNDALLKGSAAMPPADLTDRIMRQVRKEKQPKKSQAKRWIPVAVSGLAAAAVLALVIRGALPSIAVFRGAGAAADSAAPENAANVETAAIAETVENTESTISDKVPDEVEVPTAATEPVVTESPVVTDAPVNEMPTTNETADHGSTTLGGFVADFPDYHLYYGGSVTDETADSSGSLQEPPAESVGGKRAGHYYTQSAAMLIVWGTDSMEALAEFEPVDLNEYAPLTARLAPSLYQRYQAVLPLLRDFDRISPDDGFGITIYTVPYETMMATFAECVGVYENAIYYPAAFTAPDECVIVLVNLVE